MINYKHLHYFWVVAKEGGIARASERLHLTPQTISGQLSLLEEGLGEDLFTRVGRSLELTETGRLVLSYADEIFSLGGELEEMVRNLPAGPWPRTEPPAPRPSNGSRPISIRSSRCARGSCRSRPTAGWRAARC